MGIRLVVSFNAAPGRGGDFLRAFSERCQAVIAQEPGCEQYEIFQSGLDPDRLVLLEHWSDQATFDAHLEMNKTRTPIPAELRGAPGGREDYVYNRVN